jgi:hypothetical protein
MASQIREYLLPVRDFFQCYDFSTYHPIWYVIHCMSVCLYVRSSTGRAGCRFYRSFALAFLFAAGTRYCFSLAGGIQIPQIPGNINTFFLFVIIWSLYNIFPFDLIFGISSRISIAIRLLDAVAEAASLTQLSTPAILGEQATVLQLFYVNAICAHAPVLADLLDRFFYADWDAPQMFRLHHVFRFVFGSLLVSVIPGMTFRGRFWMLSAIFMLGEVVDLFARADPELCQWLGRLVNFHAAGKRKED